MGKAKKLMKKLVSGNSDRNIGFDEAALALKHNGFTLDLITGSHHTFRKVDGRRLTPPKHGKKFYSQYIKQIWELLK
jgi:predicted RNA binding protein YcfA (HicA-like mRNA interferase family)